MTSDTNTCVPDVRRAPTPADGNFHHVKAEYAGNSLSKALMSGLITDDDKSLIEAYVIETKVQKHLSTIHANKITFDLVRFRNYLGEYRKNTIIDVNRAIDRITNDPIRDPSNKSRRYKQNTLRDFVSILRGFYLWLIDNNCSQCPREKILKIGIPRGDTMTKTEEQLLTNDEVLAFIKACKTSKDRAFFATLYEGAFRIQELCTLTWGQVSIEDKMIVVNVNGKTGRIGSPYYTYSRCIGSLFC